MTLIGARRWRVEVVWAGFKRTPPSSNIQPSISSLPHASVTTPFYDVVVEPVAYVGKGEFKLAAAAFRKFFMNFGGKWRWFRRFSSHAEAKAFAAALAKFLGELAYVDNGQLCLVTPQEGA